MKRIITALIALVLVLSCFVLPCFAEEGAATDETTVTVPETTVTEEDTTEGGGENAQEPSENPVVAPERDFVGEVIAVVTNGEIWANFGVIAGGVIAVIVALATNAAKLSDAFKAIEALIKGKATKEETEATVADAMNGVRETFMTEYATLEGKYASLEEKYNTQTAVLTLVALQLVKSPNARVQIMALLDKGEDIGENLAEVVETIQEEIKAADAAEPKPETPALDTIAAEVKEERVMVLR